MKERPILFSGPMVRALLAGTKTQTRRVVKPQPRRVDGGVPFGDAPQWAHAEPGTAMMHCPHGKRGDRLWVRETWACLDSHIRQGSRLAFRADTPDGECVRVDAPWRPSIHMPRWASRITLEVTSVRVERLQDISEADAKAEGVLPHVRGGWHWLKHDSSNPNDWNQFGYKTAALAFQALWESINGPGSWDANPWVWVLEFRRLNAEQSPC